MGVLDVRHGTRGSTSARPTRPKRTCGPWLYTKPIFNLRTSDWFGAFRWIPHHALRLKQLCCSMPEKRAPRPDLFPRDLTAKAHRGLTRRTSVRRFARGWTRSTAATCREQLTLYCGCETKVNMNNVGFRHRIQPQGHEE